MQEIQASKGHVSPPKTSPVVAVWTLNGDIERMDLCVNSAPLKGFTHIYQQILCGCGIALPSR